MFEMQELRVLKAVIDESGFQKAGKLLRISQSAVSQSIANLERKLGEPLLNRNQPITLTNIGKELYEHAEIILTRERLFTKAVEQRQKGEGEVISIAVDYFADEFFCEHIIAFIANKFPALNFRIKRYAARKIIALVRSREFDFGLGPFQKDMIGLKKTPIFKETSHLAIGTAHPMYKAKFSPGDLTSFTLITSFLDDSLQRPSEKKIRNYFGDIWEIDSIELQIKLLSRGIGMTFLPEKLLSNISRRKIRTIDDLPFSTIMKQCGLYWNQNMPLKPIDHSLIKYCRNDLKKLL
ncbi:MAG: LysR family transcriptional regulator [Pseudobacteriovorax sp.]|nr:LysR family transcriptional regulator [Pseudobacteriovorax sp.]